MKIRMKTLYAGPALIVQPGAVCDMADAEAKSLVAGGYAEEVLEAAAAPTPPPVAPPVVETAALEGPPETTSVRRGGRPRGRTR